MSAEKEDESQIYQERGNSATVRTVARMGWLCGKTGIRYLCYIKNNITRKQTFGGTNCVEFFDEDIKEVLQLTLVLISTGITGKYKGSENRWKQTLSRSSITVLVEGDRGTGALENRRDRVTGRGGRRGGGKWDFQGDCNREKNHGKFRNIV